MWNTEESEQSIQKQAQVYMRIYFNKKTIQLSIHLQNDKFLPYNMPPPKKTHP